MLGFVTQVASIILPVTYTDVHLARTNFFVGEQFNLYLARAPLDYRRCRVIWQRHQEVGVEFLIPAP
jgi:hypothetical protein